MRKVVVQITTDGSGDATEYSVRISGEVHAIHYIKPGSGGFTDGVDFAITSETLGETLWTENNVNASTVRYPRVPTHSTAGAAALYASGGTGVLARPGLGSDRIKIVISSGGAAKTGAFHILVA